MLLEGLLPPAMGAATGSDEEEKDARPWCMLVEARDVEVDIEAVLMLLVQLVSVPAVVRMRCEPRRRQKEHIQY